MKKLPPVAVRANPERAAASANHWKRQEEEAKEWNQIFRGRENGGDVTVVVVAIAVAATRQNTATP